MKKNTEPTAWIQNLNKKQILEELQCRDLPGTENEKFYDLRKRLRENIKSENTEQVEQEHEKLDNITESSDSGEEIDMSSENQITFILENGEWEIFTEKMKYYFLTKNITNDKIKVATLITRIDNDAHALLKQLIAPEKNN